MTTWIVYRLNGQKNLEPEMEVEGGTADDAILHAATVGKRGGDYVAIDAEAHVRRKVNAKRVVAVTFEEE